MPATALQHFREDIGRARAILRHAEPLPHTTPDEAMLRSDMLRSAWMFAVGTVEHVLRDVEFLVERCDEHIAGEFREFLLECGCSATVIAQVGY
jgi:hypothetical protein